MEWSLTACCPDVRWRIPGCNLLNVRIGFTNIEELHEHQRHQRGGNVICSETGTTHTLAELAPVSLNIWFFFLIHLCLLCFIPECGSNSTSYLTCIMFYCYLTLLTWTWSGLHTVRPSVYCSQICNRKLDLTINPRTVLILHHLTLL